MKDMLTGAMGVQGVVVKNPDALWVEIEDFCPCPDRPLALRGHVTNASPKQ